MGLLTTLYQGEKKHSLYHCAQPWGLYGLPYIAFYCFSSCIIILASVRSTVCEEPLENRLW